MSMFSRWAPRIGGAILGGAIGSPSLGMLLGQMMSDRSNRTVNSDIVGISGPWTGGQSFPSPTLGGGGGGGGSLSDLLGMMNMNRDKQGMQQGGQQNPYIGGTGLI